MGAIPEHKLEVATEHHQVWPTSPHPPWLRLGKIHKRVEQHLLRKDIIWFICHMVTYISKDIWEQESRALSRWGEHSQDWKDCRHDIWGLFMGLHIKDWVGHFVKVPEEWKQMDPSVPFTCSFGVHKSYNQLLVGGKGQIHHWARSLVKSSCQNQLQW